MAKTIDNAPVLYSAVTYLAYNINERYYSGRHYIWCTPYFSAGPAGPAYTVPPTASPYDIYRTLATEVRGVDSHSEKIRLNKVGIRRGAEAMAKRGVIPIDRFKEIQAVVKVADIGLFRPLLCVISAHAARAYCTEVDITKRANPLSHEYIAADLPHSAFDVIEL